MALAIQSASNTSLLATVAASFASSPNQDNLLIAVVTASVGTGSISLSNTGWSTGTSIAVGAAGGMVVFYKVSDGTGNDTTVTANGTLAVFMDIQIFEYPQITNESPLDKTASTADGGAGVTSRASGTTATLTQANELAFVAVAMDGSNGGSGAWTNSFNLELTTSHLITGDISVTATTALSSTGSWSTSRRAAGVILTFFAEVGDSYGVKLPLKPRTPEINWNHPITKGLVFDMPLFEGGGSTALDLVSNTTGAITTATWATDIYGHMLSFNGTAGSVHFTTHAYQDSLIIASYELMYLQTGTGQTPCKLFVKSNSTNAGYFAIQLDNTNNNLGSVQQYTTTNASATITPPSRNIWHHCVTTCIDPNNALIYLDGVKQSVTNTAPAGVHTAESADLYIGNNSGAARTFQGYILYVRQWKRVLNAQEVKELASNPWQIYKPSVTLPSL